MTIPGEAYRVNIAASRACPDPLKLSGHYIKANMNRNVICFFVLSLSCFANACAVSQVQVVDIPKNADLPATEVQKSGIVGSEESKWKRPVYFTLASKERLGFLQVFDSKTIYVVGENNNFYKTENGGEGWRSTKLDIPRTAWISNVLFVDRLQAVVSVISPRENTAADDYDSWILTTKTGGKTWTKTFAMESSLFKDLAKDSEGTVWMSGAKVISGNRGVEPDPLLVSSKDLDHWNEIPVPTTFRGSFDNIMVRGDSSKTFVSWQGWIAELDKKMNWIMPDNIDDIRPDQIGISKVGEAEERFFMLGTTGGREGRWTSLFSKDRRAGNWRHLTVADISLVDLIVISPDELLACGLIEDGDDAGSGQTTSGLILHSFDGGSTWLVSHRSSRVGSFNALGLDESGAIWAIGDDGIVLHLGRAE